ncbi:MAG: hypothetical protein ACUVWZ_01305 [Anaerolineae bacterium]
MQNLFGVFNFLTGVPTLFGVLLASGTIFLTTDWRLSLTALSVQYVCVALLLTRSIQSEIVILKALTGVLAVSILYITVRRVQEERGLLSEQGEPPHVFKQGLADQNGSLGFLLRLLASILVVLALVQGFKSFDFPWVPAHFAFVALWMGGFGGLGLVLSSEPIRVATAILTILAGTDLLYAALESSLALVGLWSAMTLVTALAFSYLIVVDSVGGDRSASGKEGGRS